MQIGQTVKFSQGDEAGTQLIGIISRVWKHGDVTIKVEREIPGTYATYVRCADRVEIV